MSAIYVIAGTDTGVGKTVFAAALTQALNGVYFKPVQSGLDEPTDTEVVKRLTGLDHNHFLPELYRLNTPASPHIAAKLDGIEIDPETLGLPPTEKPLILEGAGGLLVPLTDHVLYIDVFARWQVPVILCARTSLGTINHSLLSIEALKNRSIPIFGIVFIGDENKAVEDTIVDFGEVRRLGRLPMLDQVDRASVTAAFEANFDIDDFMEDAP